MTSKVRLIVCCLTCFLIVPTTTTKAQQGQYPASQSTRPQAQPPERFSDRDPAQLTLICILAKAPDAKEWLYVRLSRSQYILVRTKPGLHPPDAARLTLVPRQALALRHALQLDRPMPKILLRASAKRLVYSRSLKAHYVVRSRTEFERFLAGCKGDVCEERAEQMHLPAQNLIDNIKPVVAIKEHELEE